MRYVVRPGAAQDSGGMTDAIREAGSGSFITLTGHGDNRGFRDGP